jgi:Domain of unknown function (DUF4386)
MHDTAAVPRRLWQVAGGLAIAHVVLILAGIMLQDGPLCSDGPEGIQSQYVEGDMARTFTGGLIESVGFLLLVPVLVFLSRALGRSSETGRWAAQTGLMCGIGYVVVTFAVGFPAGAAAMYGAQHGLDVDTAFAINNIRILGYFLSLMLLGGQTLAVAVTAFSDRIATRWLGVGGVVTGIALLLAAPFASIGQQDWATLIWMVWFVGMAVVLLRHQPTESTRTAPETVTVRHA